MPQSRILPLILSLVLFFLCLSILVFKGLYYWQVAPYVNSRQADQEHFYNAVVDDIEVVSSQSEMSRMFAKDTNYQNNAASLLDDLFCADTNEIIPKSTRDSLVRLENQWLDNYRRMDHWKFNIEFFKNLREFDHWRPRAKMPADIHALLSVAKLRLMQGARGQNPRPALTDVRQLGLLMISSQQFGLVHAGLTVLDFERRAKRFFEEREWLEGDYETIDRLVLRRAQRLLTVLPNYLRFWTKPEILKNLFVDRAETLPGFCSLMASRLHEQVAYQNWFSVGLPLEHPWGKGLEIISQIRFKASSLCGIGANLIELKLQKVERPSPAWLGSLPYLRSIFLTWSSINSIGDYQAYINSTPDSGGPNGK